MLDWRVQALPALIYHDFLTNTPIGLDGILGRTIRIISPHKIATQQTQNICITFIQRRPNVFDIGPTLYKMSYTCFAFSWVCNVFNRTYSVIEREKPVAFLLNVFHSAPSYPVSLESLMLSE